MAGTEPRLKGRRDNHSQVTMKMMANSEPNCREVPNHLHTLALLGIPEKRWRQTAIILK